MQQAATRGCFCSCGEILSYYVSAVGTVSPAGPLLAGHSLVRFFYLPDLLLAQSNSKLWHSLSRSSGFKKTAPQKHAAFEFSTHLQSEKCFMNAVDFPCVLWCKIQRLRGAALEFG